MIKMIAAIDRNLGLGRNNQLLFRIPADLQRFKQLTLGHTVVMGRKTFESIGQPLPGRHNIVLSRQHSRDAIQSHSNLSLPPQTSSQTLSQTSLAFMSDIEPLLTQNTPAQVTSDLFIIGGAQIYELFLPYADELLLTRIEQTFDADCLFPDWQREALDCGYKWSLAESETNLTYNCLDNDAIPYTKLDYGFYRYLKVK